MNHPDQSRAATPSVLPKIAFAAVAGLLLMFTVIGIRSNERSGWLDNPQEALVKAREGKKLVLMDFTGSDWCENCIRLDKEVFGTPEFKNYAAKNLVLVELDFPNRKYIDPQTRKQNEELSKRYNVEGFPTIIVLNSDGSKLGQFTYMDGGPAVFIAALEKLPRA